MAAQLDCEIHPTLVPNGHPLMTGPFQPNYQEFNASDMVVIGEIPKRLNGVYLRNTQNPVHQPLGTYHLFDGDGMLHMMRFENGRCEYRNRFIRTQAFMAEQAAGQALYAGLIDKPSLALRPGWGARGGLRDSSATDVIVHAGMALTTFYQCGEPYRLDPRTLEFKGTDDWDLNEVYRLKRIVVRLSRLAQPLKDMVSVLEHYEHPLLPSTLDMYLRDLYDHAIRAADRLEHARMILQDLQEYHHTQQERKNNEIMRVLTVMSSVFIPLTFLVGLWGMNFHFMPEIHTAWGEKYGYFLALGSMGALATGIIIWMKRKRWF